MQRLDWITIAWSVWTALLFIALLYLLFLSVRSASPKQKGPAALSRQGQLRSSRAATSGKRSLSPIS